jgi:CPA1 family monovalent cation:H+ antiporter
VESLVLIVGLMLAAVLLVGVGDRLRLPWPALMVVLGVVVALVPGLPDTFELDPDLILPLFLPPLLYATAQRTSWSLFRARWRSIALLAVALVVVTVIAVAGATAVLVPGISMTAAVALGAMVAPPDPVAVEAVAGPVRMPRRMLAVLQSEGLFNDATALVIFQAAVLATVRGDDLSLGGLALNFVLGAAAAVLIGLAVAYLARTVLARVTDTTGRSALTLVLPFAVYLLAEEVHASGVVAVVVVALQLRRLGDADEAAERLTQRSFWDVVELLVTGVAFGLIGLDLRQVVTEAGDALPSMLGHAAIVCAVVVGVRVLWMLGAYLVVRRSPDPSAAPRTVREAVVLAWCGMRGLATLALALSLPATVDGGAPFPGRVEITLIACAVLVVTLQLPGFTAAPPGPADCAPGLSSAGAFLGGGGQDARRLQVGREEAADVQDVLAHRGPRGLGVPLLQGREDRAVVVRGRVRPAGDPAVVPARDVVHEQVQHRRQPVRPRGPVQRAVDVVVQLLDAGRVAPRGGIGDRGLHLHQPDDLRRRQRERGPRRQLTGDVRLHREQVVDVAPGERHHPEPAPGFPAHRALAVQHHERLAYRRGAHPELGGDVLYPDERRRPQLADHDGLAQLRRDPAAELLLGAAHLPAAQPCTPPGVLHRRPPTRSGAPP